MSSTARLTGDPQLVESGDGVTRRVARAELNGDDGPVPVTIRINESPGVEFPYYKGDVVEVLVRDGDIAAGVYLVGLFQDKGFCKNDGATRIKGRADADINMQTGGTIHAGRQDPTDGGDFEEVMMFEDCNSDLNDIESWAADLLAQIQGALATIDGHFNFCMYGDPTSDPVAGPSGYTPPAAALTVTGGEASLNFKCEKFAEIIIGP